MFSCRNGIWLQRRHACSGTGSAAMLLSHPWPIRRGWPWSAIFAGAAEPFAGVTLDQSGLGAFEARIYEALRAVPRGQTTSYGALAAAVGQPGAARAVGRAMGANPWPIIVPCHRVLAAGDRMGGFSAYGAVATKERLLALEGAAAAAQARLPGL